MGRLSRCLLRVALLLAPAVPVSAQTGAVVVYVVRHAERADDEGPVDAMLAADPPLSEAGVRRARELAELLRPVGLTHVHSTDYVRTRTTAEPLSEATGIPISIYDPDDVEGFARRLLATPGTHLVVGHSNTTPALAAALGGEAGEPIDEMEYDRIYVVYVLPGGVTGSAVFRYGAPYLGR